MNNNSTCCNFYYTHKTGLSVPSGEEVRYMFNQCYLWCVHIYSYKGHTSDNDNDSEYICTLFLRDIHVLQLIILLRQLGIDFTSLENNFSQILVEKCKLLCHTSGVCSLDDHICLWCLVLLLVPLLTPLLVPLTTRQLLFSPVMSVLVQNIRTIDIHQLWILTHPHSH